MNCGGNGLVDGVASLLNNGCLDDLLDGVNLVGLGHCVWLGNLDGVRPWHVILGDDDFLNWNWIWDWNIDGDLVDVQFWLDASHCGGDPGVGAHWGEDPLLSDSVDGGGAVVPWCWGDDWGECCWDCWWSNGNGVLVTSGLSGDVGVGWGLFHRFASNNILVAIEDLARTNLDSS